MASIVTRNNWLHIAYYQNRKQFIKKLKLRNDTNGHREAEKIKLLIESYVSLGIPVDIQAIKLNLLAGVPIQIGMTSTEIQQKNGMLLSEGFEKFCSNKNITGYTHHQNIFDRFIEIIGDKKISEVTTEDGNALKNQLIKEGKKQNTIANYTDSIITIFKFFQKKKFIDEIPFEREYHDYKEIVVIPDDEMKLILDHLNKAESILDYYLIKLMWLTGFRISEALNLKKSDIDFKNKKIFLRNIKAKRNEKFPIYPELELLLKELITYSNDEQPFKKYYGFTTLKRFQKICKTLGLKKYKLHDIRRSAATRWACVLTTFELKKIIRHQSINTTLKSYINLDLDSIGAKLSI